jgi:hypothetical protein
MRRSADRTSSLAALASACNANPHLFLSARTAYPAYFKNSMVKTVSHCRQPGTGNGPRSLHEPDS